jgi:hypothetical protein
MGLAGGLRVSDVCCIGAATVLMFSCFLLGVAVSGAQLGGDTWERLISFEHLRYAIPLTTSYMHFLYNVLYTTCLN